MKLGIVGLSGSGKTTVFNALTGAHGQTAAYHAADPNIAAVKVPDERMDYLAALLNPKKVTLATIDFVDVPGIAADQAHEENVRHLAALREADALVRVIRFFEDPAVPHPHGDLDPVRDTRELHAEFAVADLDIIEKRIKKLKVSVTKPTPHVEDDKHELALLQRCGETIENDGRVADLDLKPEEEMVLRTFGFLTQKAVLNVLNISEEALGSESVEEQISALGPGAVAMCGKLEMEIAELPAEERGPFIQEMGLGEPGSARVIRASYAVLGLRSFFTVVGHELRAWTIHAGDSALAAAGKVHTDMARGFIRAEVCSCDDLKQYGDMKGVKAAGRARLEGKDYEVEDGDVITFRFKV